MMQTDALEARRQQRLEEARMRQEDRANTEWRDRSKIEAEQKYGVGALDDPRGLLAQDRENAAEIAFRSVHGAGADFSVGSGVLDNRLAADRTRRTENAKNEANRFGHVTLDEDLGISYQTGPTGEVKKISNLPGSAANDANLTALERNGHYLVAKAGFGSHREAVEFLNQSKFNPVERVAELTDKMINRQNEAYIRPGDEHYRTPEQLAQEAAAIVQSSINAVANMNRSGTAPAPTSAQGTAPPEAIEFLRQNPDLKESFRSKYGYLPEGI
jgi:hypothetical protein